ncbi:unnamed protein product [Pylaiella littoralis]
MTPCGGVLALLIAAVACVAYAVFIRGGQQQLVSEGGQRQEYELGSGKMFDSIAPRYDLINKVMSLGLDMKWRRLMVQSLELRAGDRVVDMATGTADVAMIIAGELAKLEGLGTAEGTVYPEVVGIDPSARMLEVRPCRAAFIRREVLQINRLETGPFLTAMWLHSTRRNVTSMIRKVGRGKTAEAGLSSRVRLQIGDAQDLSEIADGSVDKLTMAFGIRNVPDRLKALKEFRRIMATPSLATEPESAEQAEGGGGDGRSSSASSSTPASSVVAILELQDPESGLLASASRAFIRYMAPVLGWLMSGNGAEYGHLKNSILGFPSVAEWTALMEEAGKNHVFSHGTMGFGTVHLYLARPRPDSR